MEPSNLFVCLMGLGTVFFGLICLIVLTTIMGKIAGGPTVRNWWPPSPPPSRRSWAPILPASGSCP